MIRYRKKHWSDLFKLYGEEFQLCTNGFCPLREKCERNVPTPCSSEYYTTRGNYNKKTNICTYFVKITF